MAAGNALLSELQEEIESLRAIFYDAIITQDLSSRNVTYINDTLEISMLLKGNFKCYICYMI